MKGCLKVYLKAIIVCFLMIGFQFVHAQNKNHYTNLSPEEFYIKINQNPEGLVIDARLKPDFEEYRIPGAILAEKREVLIQVVDTLDRGIPLFVYCYDGDRSKTACKLLTRHYGFREVYNLKNGLEVWKKMGFPLDEKAPDKPL